MFYKTAFLEAWNEISHTKKINWHRMEKVLRSEIFFETELEGGLEENVCEFLFLSFTQINYFMQYNKLHFPISYVRIL